YMLAIAVGQSADELSNGANPLLEQDTQQMKHTDLAIDAIAAGLSALWGGARGGASEGVMGQLRVMGDGKNVRTYIAKAEGKNDPLR
ncbi:citrate/2-methylcitrate synthase, partial [Aliarcobacter butzleri]|uniref:citrate/2-methylcitrate synthase n=1 Tax=Aliarcobacter butzleri TaxID=28197 RepID=UPI003AF8633A